MRRAWPLWILLLGVACRPPRTQRLQTPAVTDDAGRVVTLAAPATRIVSLAPSSTELLFGIGAGPQVVGRTTWCRYPAAALAVPVVGDGLDPNVEAVAATRPDLVVLYRSASNATVLTQLDHLGIPAVVLRQDRLADVARDARLLGALTGHATAGDSIAEIIDSITAAPLPPVRTRIAFLVWDSPPIVIGAGSFLDELGRRAGAENVFHDIAGASAPVSLESIAARNPDLIAIVEDSTAPATPAFAKRPEWRVIRAVKLKHILHLPGDLFGRPTPRAAAAVAEFAHLLPRVVPKPAAKPAPKPARRRP